MTPLSWVPARPQKRLVSLKNDAVTVLHQSPTAVAAAAQPKKFEWVQSDQLVPGFNPVAAIKPRQPAGAGRAPRKRSRGAARHAPSTATSTGPTTPAALPAPPSTVMPSLTADLMSLPMVDEILMASLGTSILSDDALLRRDAPTAAPAGAAAKRRSAAGVRRGDSHENKQQSSPHAHSTRTRISREVLTRLIDEFNRNSHPSATERRQLAESLGMDPRTVQARAQLHTADIHCPNDTPSTRPPTHPCPLLAFTHRLFLLPHHLCPIVDLTLSRPPAHATRMPHRYGTRTAGSGTG